MTQSGFIPPPFHPERPGLVAPVRVDPTGRKGPTRGQSRGPGWRTTSWGLHVPASVERTVDQRIVEAAAAMRPRKGAVTGWAGLRWLGARWLDGSTPDDPEGLPVDLAIRGDLRPREGVRLCEEKWDPREIQYVDGVFVTVPLRSAAYAIRRAPDVRSAAVMFAMAAYDDLVSVSELHGYLGTAPREGLSSWTGVPQGRAAMLLADENCWSPQEARMLMIWCLDAGLPRPLMNHPVFDRSGRLIGTPDMIDLESGTACEYEGDLHLVRGQRRRDVRREEAFRGVGLEVLTLMAGDVTDRRRTARRMVAARGRARWEPAGDRAWTIEPPAWWVPTTTVAQRRQLSDEQRARLLGHRIAA